MRRSSLKQCAICSIKLYGHALSTSQFPVNSHYSAIRRNEEPALPEAAESYVALTRRDYIVRRYELSRRQFLLLLSAFFYVPLYLALIVGIFILRRREPGSERPYRAWGHPYSTIVCLVGWTIITFYQAYAERETALYALVMVAVSWPVYRHLANRK